MKFGAHIYIWTDRWSDDCLGLLERAKSLGLDFVELSCGGDVHFSAALTRQHAEDLGLKLTMSPGGVWPMDCDVGSQHPENRRKGMEWHHRALDLTAAVGAVAYCGAMYGHPGNVDRSRPHDATYETTAECLHELAEYAAGLGVRLVLEPMSRFRTHMVNTPQQMMRLLEMSDHSNLAALLDTWHMVNEVRDYGRAVRTYGESLWGIHACGSDRGVPGGDLVEWDGLFDAAVATGFDGYVAFESYNTSVRGGEFALSRGVFRDICPDGDEFVRQGLAFVTAGLDGAARRKATAS